MRGHWHAGGLQGTPQRGQRRATAHKDRHPRPGHLTQQMHLAQSLRDEERLGAGRGEEVNLCRAGVEPGRRPQVAMRGRPGQPLRDPTRGGQQVLARAPAHVELDHGGRRAVRCPKAVGEAADAFEVGAAKSVDRLIGIANRKQVAAADEQREQLLLGRVGVLVLVDDHELVSRPNLLQDKGI